MRMHVTRSSAAPRLLSLVAALSGVALLAGCGGGDGGGGAASPSGGGVAVEGLPPIEVDPELQAMLPEDLREGGTVSVATNAPFPPYEMFRSETDQTLVGLEPDLGHAIGAKLGVDFEFAQQPFDGLVPGLQAGRYDVVMATLFDTAEREEVIDLVNYAASGSGIMVAAGNPEGIATPEDLCGQSVAVQTGSQQVDLVGAFSQDCTAAGEAAIEVLTYPQYSDELLALSTGAATAVVGDVSALAYSLTEEANEGRFEVLEDPAAPNGYDSAPIGIGVGKDSPELRDAIAGAVQALMDDGTYTELLEKWELPQIAVDSVSVNAATR